MSNSKKIVIGFTPFHALFAERLIPVVGGDVYCLFTKGWPRVTGFKKLGFFWPGNVFRILSYLASFLYFSIVLRFWLWRSVAVEVYLPHPKNIFSNFLFFSNKVSKVHVYEDGLLNYYDAPSSRASIPLWLRCYARCCGVSITDFDGHLAGYDAREVSTLYVSRAGSVVAREKVGRVVELKAAGNPFEPVQRRVLFLDQDISAFVSDSVRAQILERMAASYPVDLYQYFYKGHHDFNCDGLGMAALSSELNSAPAELVVNELHPEIVFSFFSSALLNISALNSKVQCISLASDIVPISRDGVSGTLADIFDEAGVTCFLGVKA